MASSPRLLVYQTLFSLLHDISLYDASRIYNTLGSLHDTMPAYDSISAIVKSHDWRKTLLQAATELGIYGDERFRDAIRKDEEQIANLLLAILNSDTERAAVLRLEGDSAQHFLDVVQNTLDRGYFIHNEHSSKARRIIIKLSEACDKLPSSLFITGVTGRDEHATFGGGFGDIYRASYTGKRVALKHLRTFRDAENRGMSLQFCREALVWQHLHHPFILPLIGIDRETFMPSICMVSPWMEHGTVLKYLKDYGRANVDKLLSEIARGMQYLHSKNIVHGDLRGANILITHEWSACLADFGLTTFSNATTATHTSHRAGSIRWMAPELIDPKRFGHRFVRTPATDVYAFGCVCLELYTGKPPFADVSETASLLKVINGERPERPSTDPPMSEALWQHVNACWVEDSAMRPDTDIVVKRTGLDYLAAQASPYNPDVEANEEEDSEYERDNYLIAELSGLTQYPRRHSPSGTIDDLEREEGSSLTWDEAQAVVEPMVGKSMSPELRERNKVRERERDRERERERERAMGESASVPEVAPAPVERESSVVTEGEASAVEREASVPVERKTSAPVERETSAPVEREASVRVEQERTAPIEHNASASASLPAAQEVTPAPVKSTLATTMKKLFGRDKPKEQPLQPPAQQIPLTTPIHQQFVSRPRSSGDDERWEVVEKQPTPPLPGASPPVLSPTRSPSSYTIAPAKPPSQQQILRKKAPPVVGFLLALDPVQQQQQMGHVRQRSEERPSENGHTREKEKEKSKGGGGFWGRNRERDKDRDRERDRERERERERAMELERETRERDRGRERRDEENELTRKIGFLTATASEDWRLVFDVSDQASANESNAKEAVRALRHHFKYGEPAAQLAAARLWAIMLRNSSDTFISQSTSHKFLNTLEDLLTSSRTSPVVRERVMDVLAAAAYASGTKKDTGFRGLWRRVKPRDMPEEGVPFDTEDAMFNPPPPNSRVAAYDYDANSANVPVAPIVTYHDATPTVPDTPPVSIIPSDEDMRRLFQECKIGVGNALLLSQALATATPEDLSTSVIAEFYKKCQYSQELIFTQIPWVSASAERSRVAMDQEDRDRERDRSANTLNGNGSVPDLGTPMSTHEEELLAELLAANADLIESLRLYDDLKRVAIEREAEDRS